MEVAAVPTLVERVAELERFRAEAARQLGIPESDKAVSEAVDHFVASAQEKDAA